jgi:hypothetical protein
MNEVDVRALDGPQFAIAYLDTIDALCHNSPRWSARRRAIKI